jgi:tetratricopeptide (TPR) repeat protein
MMNEAFNNQDFDGLQRAAINALSQNANDAKALAALGVVNYQKKKYLAAMYFFDKSLQQGPGASEVYNNMGLVQLALKEPKEAIKLFRKAYETNPSDGVAAANLGCMYAQQGDYGKALGPLERAVKSGLKDARIYNNFGISLTAAGQYEEAKTIYEEAMKLNKTYREAMLNYAILLIDHLNQNEPGLDVLGKLRFLGLAEGMRERINSLEIKAKAGVK